MGLIVFRGIQASDKQDGNTQVKDAGFRDVRVERRDTGTIKSVCVVARN